MSIYLDHAAATPLDSEVLAAMQPFFTEQFYNPSALYGPAVGVSKALDQARTSIAAVLGAKASEIIFTAGGTEANNLAIHGIMQKFPEGHMVYSAIEHDSVRVPAQRYNASQLVVDGSGIICTKKIHEVVTPHTVLVSVMYANNEVGTVQPIRLLALEIDKIRKDRQKSGNTAPIFLHIDAAQAGNYLDMHVHRLGVDMMTLNGGKLYGPKQSGALFVRSGVILEPQILGGGQERNLRSGTENVAGAVGLATALQKSVALQSTESKRMQALQKQFIAGVQETIPGIIINGSTKHRLPNNIHITVPGIDNERLLLELDMQDIFAAAGSACSASHDEPSHVLAAMGIDDAGIRSSLVFCMGRGTDAQQIGQTIAALRQILA